MASPDFAHNLRDILSVARTVNASVLLVVPPLSEKIARLQPWARRYRSAARRVGGCRKVDAARDFETHVGEGLFQPDELHPSRAGALRLARAIADRVAQDHTLGVPTNEGAIPADVIRGVPGTRARFAAARDSARAGRCTPAQADLRALLDENPRLVEAHQILAECAAQRGDAAAAIRELEAGVRLDRGWIHGRALLAAALHASGRDAEARRHVSRGLRIAPEDRDLRRIAKALNR